MRVCRRVLELRLLVLLGGACCGAFSGCSEDTPITNAAMEMAGQPAAGMIGAAAGAAPVAQAGAPAGTAGSGMISGAAGSGAAGGAGAGAGTTAGAGGAGAGGSAGSAMAGASGTATAGAGAGGSSGMAGAAGASGMGGMPAAGGGGAPAVHEDLKKGDGSDVVTIGDSWMNLILTGIEQSLDKVSGQKYQHYAVPGTLVLNEQIPNQFKQAVSDHPMIKTLVMTGGGNDILTSPCAGTECNPIVDDVAERLATMLTDIDKAGVQDVIIIGYTYPADETKRESLDHSREVSMKTCMKTGMPRCHFVDSSKLDITLQDGIHPNAAGCDLIAKTVFDLMTSEGMRR